MHRLRHRHAAELVGALQGFAAHGLGEQVVAQWWRQSALGLRVEHRHVFLARRRQLQLALGVQFANGEIAQAFITHLLFKRGPFGTADSRGVGVGLGAQQQGAGVTVEFGAGH